MIDTALSSKISNMGVVCAMLVVALHICPNVEVGSFTWVVDRFIHDGIGRAAVPYFFAVSGFFLARHIGEDKWWRNAVCSRARTLLVPYLVWNLLWVLLPMVSTIFVNLLKDRSTFSGIMKPEWGGMFALPLLGPTWYIRSLFLFVILSPVLVAMLRKNAKVVIAASFLLYIMFYKSTGIPFGTWRAIPNTPLALEGLVYFLVGIKLAMDGMTIKIPWRIGVATIVIAVVFTALRIYCKISGLIPLYNHLRFLVVPGFLWLLWQFVPAKVWPRWIASSAFAIYLIHPFSIAAFRRIVSVQIDGFMLYSLCGIFAILLSIALRLSVSMISQRLLFVLFGGR